MSARVLLTGGGGQLASAIRAEFAPVADVFSFTRAELDITDSRAVRGAVGQIRPTLIINCAAYNLVDQAETDAVAALSANALGVRVLAQAAREATLVHYSTDFVFDGTASVPYTEADRTNPASVYGTSKLLGEWFALQAPRGFVFRVASLYGGSPAKSSVDRIIDALSGGREVRVFVDRAGSPSYVNDVAAATRAAIDRAEPGLYHCTGTGQCTWHELALEIARILGPSCRGTLTPVHVADIPMLARRPQYSALSNAKLRRYVDIPTWQNALERYVKSPNRLSGAESQSR